MKKNQKRGTASSILGLSCFGVLLMSMLIISCTKANDTVNKTADAKRVKIGFVVKQPEAGWFQEEWANAEKAAEELNFDLVKIGAQDGEKVIAAINNLGSQQAQGMIICTPDVKLGPSIIALAEKNGLKVMSVDDRFVDGNGEPIEEVPHMGISAYKIGQTVGQAIYAEAEQRGWDLQNVGVMALSYAQLPTAMERTRGATDALLKAGIPEANIFDTPHKQDNTEQALYAANALISKKPNVKQWFVYGMNDQVVIGGVRGLENNGFSSDDIIGIGINGSEEGLNEFKKEQPTGFVGTIVLSAKQHGYETALNMYKWIHDGVEPPPITYTSGILATRENYLDIVK